MSEMMGGTPRARERNSVSEATVSVDGTRIHYLEAGDGGPPIVLLHGGIIDAADISWGELIGPLAAETRVIIPDLPGYGDSEMPEGPLGVPEHAEIIAGFLEELELDSVVLAGVSLGGGVAIGVGLDHPDRVSHVVALDAFTLDNHLPGGKLTWAITKTDLLNRVMLGLMRRSRKFVKGSLEALTAENRDVPETTVDRVSAEAQREGADAGFRAFQAAEITPDGYRTVYGDRLDELTVPIRFIHGAEDGLFPPEWAERGAERAPEADVFVLEDCGHLSTLERPERIHELIREIL